MRKHEIIVVEEKKSCGALRFLFAVVTVIGAAVAAISALKLLSSKHSKILAKIDIDGDGDVDATMIDTDGDGEVDTIVFHDDEE